MTRLNSFLLAMLLAFVSIPALAWHDFKVDGIYYNKYDYYDYKEDKVYVSGADESLVSIDIPSEVENNGTTYTVDFISYEAFQGSNIISIVLPSTITKIADWTFSSCKSLTSVVMPNVTSIGSFAFGGCTSLTSVDLSNVTSIGSSAFWECSNIRSVRFKSLEQLLNISTGVEIGTDLMYYFGDSNEPITDLIIPESIEAIPDYAFYGCSSLTSVVMPNVTSIGASAFKGCSSLESVASNSIVYIGYDCFYNCFLLKNINLSNVTEIGNWAFYGCKSLTDVDLSNVTTVDFLSFYGCENIKSVRIGSLEQWFSITGTRHTFSINKILYIGDSTEPTTKLTIPESVETIPDDAFHGFSNITDVTLPTGLISIGECAFTGTGIKEIIIGDKVKKIGGSAFSGCTALETVHIGESVETIGSYAFSGCKALETVHIGESVETIDLGAFRGCVSLPSIHIGEKVKTIGVDAFSDCTALKTIYAAPMTPPTFKYPSGKYDPFGYLPFESVDQANCALFVKNEAKDAYMAAAIWKDFLFGDYDNPNGVEAVENESENYANAKAYNLNGQRVDASSHKGILIIDGKKVFVK